MTQPDQAPQTLDELAVDRVGKKIDGVWHEFVMVDKAALTALIERVIGEDYPKGYPYDDPEFVRYANIEHDRQRKRLANLTKNGE